MIALDLETSCRGESEYRVWRDGFKIDSISLSWRDEAGQVVSWYSDEAGKIDAMIRRLAETQKPLVVHNLAFEMCVFMKLYPGLTFNWAADTMRLAQLDDNSGGRDWRDKLILNELDELDALLGEEEVEKPKSGLSLEACASRYLPAEFHNHKGPAHKWLEDNHGIRTRHGQYLNLLPPDVLRQYNIADTEVTLRLYEELAERLRLQDFDWSLDWSLYTTRCRLMQSAYLRGIKIGRDKLREEILRLHGEIEGIRAEFLERTVESRALWAERFPGKIKSRPTRPGDFNIGSNQQLARLFLDVMGINTGHVTATGKAKVESGDMSRDEAAVKYPSFAAKHLADYGPLGELLLKRRKALLVLQQMLGVYMGSDEDGRLHPEVKVSGTSSNRVAGSSNAGAS